MTTDPAGPQTRTRLEIDVDPERWPDVAAVPHCPVRARAAAALLRRAARHCGIDVHRAAAARPPASNHAPSITILREDEFLSRLGRDGLIGFGEAWMSRAWDTDDLPAVLFALARNLPDLVPAPLRRLRRLVDHTAPASEDGDLHGARRNVARHYDVSNDLFATFLDPTMTYSAAMFEPGDDLERAQLRKIDAALDAARVGPGTHLLEIGSGWGALAIRAAKQRGARVTTLTLSPQQAALARERARVAGVADRVDVRLQDYREVDGTYSSIVSIEMIEAVGERHWPGYFRSLGRLLAPRGRLALQAITMPHEHMMATRRSWTWIHKYIFPGGLIPSVEAIRRHAEDDGHVRIVAHRSFGPDYATTLKLWRERLLAADREVAALGFDKVFRRMWEFYLAYSEAGFRSGRLGVSQLTMIGAS